MRVERLILKNFRNIESLELLPYGEMNVICGENAQGKTNIIEALWLFSGAKSFRSSKDSSFIKFGENKALAEVEFIFGGVKNDAQMEFNEKRTACLCGKKLSNPSKLAGIFNAVVFSPYDLSLVKDGPAARRKFADTAIGQLYPNYIELLRNYIRAVSQRNKIIKDYKYDGSLCVMLDVFEEEMAQNGAKIIEYRKRYLRLLSRFLPEIYSGLSLGKENIEANYISSFGKEKNAESIKKLLENSRKNDSFTGVTSLGPHRDDIEFKINGVSVRSYGSQGQKRSCALSLKLGQGEIINEISGEYPIFLLDDVMSELDPTRQNYILNHIKGRQSFITCCDPNNTAGLKKGKIFSVCGGKAEECI